MASPIWLGVLLSTVLRLGVFTPGAAAWTTTTNTALFHCFTAPTDIKDVTPPPPPRSRRHGTLLSTLLRRHRGPTILPLRSTTAIPPTRNQSGRILKTWDSSVGKAAVEAAAAAAAAAAAVATLPTATRSLDLRRSPRRTFRPRTTLSTRPRPTTRRDCPIGPSY
jgi:hypothetical protein